MKRMVFVGCCLPNLKTVVNWFRSEGNPLFSKELKQLTGLHEFAFRPYVNIKWGINERLHAIANHYRLVKYHSPLLNIDNNEFIDIFSLNFGEQLLKVTIDKPAWMRREGEVALSLFLGTDRIYTVMFLLDGELDNLKMIVGNLQGDARDRAETYKEFTKFFHGLRPRDFLINLLKLLAEHIGCKEIYAVSDEVHRSNLWYSKAGKESKYDMVWQEHGGKKNDEGFYVISAYVSKRAENDIPTKKRAVYRRRYEFLDALKLQLKDALMNHPPANILNRDRRMNTRYQ